MLRSTGCLHRRRAIRAGEGSVFFVVRSRHLLIQISQEDWSRVCITTMSQQQLLTPPPTTPPNQTILGNVLAVCQFRKQKVSRQIRLKSTWSTAFGVVPEKNIPEKREHQPEYQAFLGEKGKERREKGRERTHISSPLAPQEGLILRLREHLKKQPCIPDGNFQTKKKLQFQALAAVFR